MGFFSRAMRGLLLFLLVALAASQTIPAVYYDLYFINRDSSVGLNQVETIDANGGNRAVIYNQFTGNLSDSLAFDGTYLYVVVGRKTIVRTSISIPATATDLITFQGVSCVGIGHADRGSGRSILYFGVTSNTTTGQELWTAELNGTDLRRVTTWPSGTCSYVIQYQNIIFWTTSSSAIYQHNTTTDATVLVASAPQGNATGGITTVAGSNLMLYASEEGVNLPLIESNNLNDLVTGQSPVQTLWTDMGVNNTYALISLNGAAVASTDEGILFFFSPFGTTGVQFVARQILSSVSSIRGLATNSASVMGVSAAALMMMMMAMLFVF